MRLSAAIVQGAEVTKVKKVVNQIQDAYYGMSERMIGLREQVDNCVQKTEFELRLHSIEEKKEVKKEKFHF